MAIWLAAGAVVYAGLRFAQIDFREVPPADANPLRPLFRLALVVVLSGIALLAAGAATRHARK